MGMLDKDQLEALRRQVEEEYRMDMAAIERLQRRFVGQPSPSSLPSRSINSASDAHVSVLPTVDPQAQAQPDELAGTLRAMFSSNRK